MLFGIRFPNKVCLVLGNETKGVYRQTLALCDGAVYIPMYGKGPSMNVHVAGALVAYQALLGKVTDGVLMRIDPNTIDMHPDLVESSAELASGQRVDFRPLRADQAAELGAYLPACRKLPAGCMGRTRLTKRQPMVFAPRWTVPTHYACWLGSRRRASSALWRILSSNWACGMGIVGATMHWGGLARRDRLHLGSFGG